MKFPAVDVDKEPLLRKNSAVKLYAPVDDSVEDGLRLDIDDAHPNNSTYLSPSFNGPKGYKSEGGSPSAMRQYESIPVFESKARMPKRGGKKRIRRRAMIEKKRVSSYCISNEIQIEPLLEYLQLKHGRMELYKNINPLRRDAGFASNFQQQVCWVDVLYSDVIYSTTDKKAINEELVAKSLYKEDGYESPNETDREYSEQRNGENLYNSKDIFILPYGCIIFWGLNVAEELEFLADIRKFAVGVVSESELQESQDDMNFSFEGKNSEKDSKSIKADEIVLGTTNALEKLSYSFALAQSAKLFVFEDRLGNIIEQTRKYPEELRTTGKISLSESQMNKLIGKVLVERNEVNLHSDVLDMPEFFWETQTWEPEYQRLVSYLDMPLRLSVINKRLDVLRELLDVLHNQITNTHATRLEVIIIYLVLMEVLIEIVWNIGVKDILGFFK